MAEHGYVRATVYTARGAIPIGDAVMMVTMEEDGKEAILAMRRTDEDGITPLVQVDTPPVDLSQAPDPSEKPFATVNLKIEYPGYYTVVVRDVQVFSGQISDQQVELVPLEENAPEDSRVETFTVTPQSL